LPYAEKLGVAMQLTNILRDVMDDYKSDRIYLPLNEMKQHGVTEDMLAQKVMTDSMKSLMKHLVQKTHQLYDEASPGIALLDKDVRYAIYSASRIYREILINVETNQYNPFLKHTDVTRYKKFRIIFGEWFNQFSKHK
ncbi:phytoene/squalene synthase family protein, partial [bacterium]